MKNAALFQLKRQEALVTRGHCLKLEKRHCNMKLRQNVFRNRTVIVWNGLPEDIVTAPSLNSFKGRCPPWSVLVVERSAKKPLWSTIKRWRRGRRNHATIDWHVDIVCGIIFSSSRTRRRTRSDTVTFIIIIICGSLSVSSLCRICYIEKWTVSCHTILYH